LQNTSFDRDLIEMLTAVFEEMSCELGLAAVEDALRDTLARVIIQCARQGMRDPLQIRQCAYASLKPT
jgi:ribosome maturation factor RimP